tara:strand:- start:57 stop:548 length:492 start_codon:yes stop_codon:yes gene_type:complete
MTKEKQEELFHSWLTDHKPILYKIIRVYFQDLDDQNDLFQEITIQLWKSIPNFKAQCLETTWIYRVALNTALKWKKKARKNNPEQITEDLIKEPAENTHPHLDWLYHEISLLNKIDRSLTLLMLDGFGYKDMSEILGITTSNVGVKINRIKIHLQERSKLLTS